MTTSLSILAIFTSSFSISQATITVRVMTASNPSKAVGQGYQVLVRESKAGEIIAGGYTSNDGDVPLSLDRNTGKIWIEVIQKGDNTKPDRSDGKWFTLPFPDNKAIYKFTRQLTSVTVRYHRIGRFVPVWYLNPWTCTRFCRMQYVECYERIEIPISNMTHFSDSVETGALSTKSRIDELEDNLTAISQVKMRRTPLSRKQKKLKTVTRTIVRVEKIARGDASQSMVRLEIQTSK